MLVYDIRIASDPFTTTSHSRFKRFIEPSFGSFDSTVWSVGVPRGVPDEYKARNQIAAGFESISLWSTIIKNVDWISYLYYNQQRFINYNYDALEDLAEQLAPTSLMTWHNGLVLDMLLAERGGVCALMGDTCCTFIQNNTASDGSVTRALERVSRKLKFGYFPYRLV